MQASDPTLWVARDGQLLLDAVQLRHGPKRDLGRFFLLAASMAEAIGVTIRIHDDMASIILANAQYPGGPWGLIAPAFDPGESKLEPGKAFWVSVHNSAGTIVACTCARLMEPQGSIYDELTSLRLFYANPQPYLAAGATCTPKGAAEIATGKVKGRIIYSGAQWTHPTYRSRGIVHILTRVTRLLGLTRWDVDFVTGVTRVDLLAAGQLAAYGFVNSVRVVEFLRSYRGDLYMNFMWMGREEIETELAVYLAAAQVGGKTSRVTDDVDTPIPKSVDQGSNSLS